jgi:ATP-dependent Lon protease
VPPTTFAKKDIHVHVPEGATPKDGPSAGVAMVTSIVSVMTGVAVRKDVAMTGEITLRGRVLRIGGLKEKLLAAHRGGLRRVLIPKDNERELSEIPDNIKRVLEIMPVATVDEVLANALVSELSPIEWDEKAELEAAIAVSRVEEDEAPGGVITH